MAPSRREQLRSIKRFPSLVKYLRDELDWPIESDDFEALTFEFTPEELGIDKKNAAKIEEIKRLRPLSASQPWGIFFVKFDRKKLPVVALRRLLNAVALKKRASANRADQAVWHSDDLLFISNYGEEDDRKISFAHFSQDERKQDLPVLKVLGWDDKDTALHLDDVADTLEDKLTWDDAYDKDPEQWRKHWRAAFTVAHGEVVRTSKDMAVRLAELARKIRVRINEVLAIESEKGPIRQLMSAFQEALIDDLDEDGFADMYAQTIAYGLLSARVTNPSGDTPDDLATAMPITNPFLKELMEQFLQVGGRKRGAKKGTGIDFDELGVSEVIALLDNAKMEAVLKDFGDQNPQEDPVIHFFEGFLQEYDKKAKKEKGVFYTPRPVVSFIVRSVDELLRTEFGLQDGLADTTTWEDMTERIDDLEIPEGAKGEQAFVQILDPATGTGTFLVEVIDLIYKTMTEKWKAEHRGKKKIDKLWNDYVPMHLLPRLHGYELMMAPYAIAHMKIGLKLYETGYRFESDERARVYLTNALEPAQDFSGTLAFAIPALAHEAEAVNAIKRDQRFTVVIGNPPYSVSSWNTGAWISDLTEDYKRTVRMEESQIQSLSNDYIKFLRFSQWLIETSRYGLLGFITGHGYLHGTQSRDLRKHLSEAFDTCYCLDLHGSIRRTGTGDSEDEPVFQIMTGVAILIGSRDFLHAGQGAALQASLTGRLERKLSFLVKETATSATAQISQHRPTGPYFFLAESKTDQDLDDEYRGFIDLPAVFGTGDRQKDKETYWATGFATQQDDLAISFSPAEVERKMTALAESKSFDDLRQHYRLCTTNQWDYQEARKFAAQTHWREHLAEVTYRPFDRRWTVYHRNVLTITRKRVMSQLTGSTEHNIGLISSRAVNDLAYAHCFVTNEPVDKISISSKTSTNAYVFPLYFMEHDAFGDRRRPNLSAVFLSTLGATLGLPEADGKGVPGGPTPEEIFQYAYAIFHSPSYRSRYAEFLKIDFPRLPLTANLALFRALSALGSQLVSLHLLESPTIARHTTSLVRSGDMRVEKVSYSDETVWLNKEKTCGFRGVSEDVWNFHIGGYRVCEKWLKDRQAKGGKNPRPGLVLADTDIEHYQKVVVALSETIRIMSEIDDAIERHDGWPNAFERSVMGRQSEPEQLAMVAESEPPYGD